MLKAERTGETEKGVRGWSPLASLPNFDTVWSFTLDHMHTVDLGTMKDLLLKWFKTPDRAKFFIEDVNAIRSIDSQFSNIQTSKDITRCPQNRSINDCHKWKASEYRNFLLLFGPIVLMNVLKSSYYEHFLKLSKSIYIFNKSLITRDEFQDASRLIIEFVDEFEMLYGEAGMKYNVHALIHIPSCVLNLGPLHCYSLFAYESKNNFVNHYVNGTNNVIQEATSKISLYQKNFLGQHLKPSKYCVPYLRMEDISVLSKPKKAELTVHQKILINRHLHESLLEVKYFIKNRTYFEVLNKDKKKKTCDSYILLKSGIFGYIEKILIDNNEIFIIICEEFTVSHMNQHQTFVRKNITSNVQYSSALDISKKVLFFADKLVFTSFPNNIEKD